MNSGSALLPRPRLVQLLGVPPGGTPRLTVVSAPRGYGKTTLLGQWVDSLPAGYPTLRASAGGLTSMDELWCELARCAARDMGDAHRHVGDSGEECRASLAEWVAAQVAPPVIVVDDFEGVTSAAADREVFQAVESNRNVRLLVAGRRFTSLDAPFVAADADRAVLRQEDLAFTPHETRVFMDDRAFPPGSRAHAVMGRLEGWPAAAMLVLAHAAGDDSGDLDQEALTGAVSASMPDPRSRQVLALVAVLPRMSERFLAEAAGLTPGEVTPLLLDLQDRGLIRRSWVGARQVYSPHPAVQDPVFWAGTAQLLPAQVRDLQIRFAHQLGPEEAARSLHLLLEAGEYEAADQYILDRFSALVADPGAALPLLRAIPEAERSRMVGALGLSLTLERPAGAVPAEGLDQLAETLLQAVRNPAEQGQAPGAPGN